MSQKAPIITKVKYLKTICFTAFFLSGLASIVYELTWIRLLRNIFGSDSLAFSSLLTIFIGGIATGTFLSGKFIKKFFSLPSRASEALIFAIDKAKNFFFILIYGLIELLVGIYALITPLLLSENTLGSTWIFLSKVLNDNIILLSLSKFLIAGFVLILPTLLLGLSYPILVELVTSNENKTDNKYRLGSSNLYATNTLGSIFGSIIGGFLLIPHFGLKTSILIATLINFFIGFLIFVLHKTNIQMFSNFKIKEAINFLITNAKTVKLENQNKLKKSFSFWLLVSIGVILGFSNLGLEVIWNKIFALIIGSSVYSATIVISVVLAGISFGAYSLNYFSKKVKNENIDIFLCAIIFAFSLLIFASSFLLNACPWFFVKVHKIFTALAQDNSWIFTNITKYLTVSLIIFPVTFLEGLAYAIVLYKASEITKEKNDPVGSRIAVISYWNTIGAILGSFSAGFILIPFFSQFGSGITNSIRFILALAFITTILSLISTGKAKLKHLLLLIAIAITAIYCVPTLAKNTLNSGTEIYKATKFKDISKKKFLDENEEILFYKEGLNSIVTVVKDDAANAIFLKNNGKIEAGIPLRPEYPSKADTITQDLLGILPILLKPDSKNALVVGMGSGKTVASLAISGKENNLEEITVCEIEREIFNASKEFFVKSFPIKVNKKNIDARNFLNTTKESFDLIISQPSDPWISGALFTKEFWYKVKSRLSAQGIFLQWLQLYSLDEEHLEIALRTFIESFPQSYIFRPPFSAELILVGTDNLNFFNINKTEENIFKKDTYNALSHIGINDSADLFANLVLTPKDLNALKNKAGINTDDNMSLELHTSKNIDNFFESIKTNNQYLKKLAQPNNLYNFFSSIDEINFLTKLSVAHNKFHKKNNQEISSFIINKIHQENPSPMSFLALYEIYKSDNEFEKADSIIYEAAKTYSDSISKINNQTFIFKNLHNDFHSDFDQTLAMYKIFLNAQDRENASKAELLLRKQLVEKKKELRKIYLAEIFYEKAKSNFANLTTDPDYKTLEEVLEDLKRARKNNPQNYLYLKEQAKVYLYKAKLSPNDADKYKDDALNFLEAANKIYALDYETHEMLADIYYETLPKSEIKFISKSSDSDFENKLQKTINFLKNTLDLNQNSIKANYYMADIQYKMGNLKLCIKHLDKLTKICEDQNLCLSELNNDNKLAYETLNSKINNLTNFEN